MARGTVLIQNRIDPALYERIKAYAAQNNRSANYVVEQVLLAAFPGNTPAVAHGIAHADPYAKRTAGVPLGATYPFPPPQGDK